MKKKKPKNAEIEKCEAQLDEIRKREASAFAKEAALSDYPVAVRQEAEKNFSDPKLLQLIFSELSKSHVDDDSEKMLLFLTAATALMQSKDRISCRVCGDSSGGKDNMIDAVFRHMPTDVFIKLSGSSDKFLLRYAEKTRGIIPGELNLQRRGGSNQNLIEVLKARSESGTSYGFLEPGKDGKYVARVQELEKATIIVSTTEIDQDDELATRQISIPVTASPEQTKKILEHLADDDEEVSDKPHSSWIACGLSMLAWDSPVKIPVPLKRGLVEFADTSDVRARRDIKRLFAIIRASAFLHQTQRFVIGGKILADKADVYYALTALGNTLDSSYASIERRLAKVIDWIRKHAGTGWILKKEVAQSLGLKGKNRQADVFKTLESLLITEERQYSEDKRFYEVRLTGRPGVKFIKGGLPEIMNHLYHICKPIIPISQNGATDSEKIGLMPNIPIIQNGATDSEKIGLMPNIPIINFISGEQINDFEKRNQDTYLNLSKPIIKPINKSYDTENVNRYIEFKGGEVRNPCEQTILDIVSRADFVSVHEIKAHLHSFDRFLSDQAIESAIGHLKRTGQLFEPNPGRLKRT